jgi:hypothetical protein
VLRRRRRLLTIAVPAGLLFLAVSFGVARFLSVEGRERDAITTLLEAETTGDPGKVAAGLDGCDAACRARIATFLPRLAGPGEVKIARLDSKTAYTFGTAQGWTRVVWVRGLNGRPVVQCVLVRREGSPLTGRSVSLRRLGAPLADNEGSC